MKLLAVIDGMEVYVTKIVPTWHYQELVIELNGEMVQITHCFGEFELDYGEFMFFGHYMSPEYEEIRNKLINGLGKSEKTRYLGEDSGLPSGFPIIIFELKEEHYETLRKIMTE